MMMDGTLPCLPLTPQSEDEAETAKGGSFCTMWQGIEKKENKNILPHFHRVQMRTAHGITWSNVRFHRATSLQWSMLCVTSHKHLCTNISVHHWRYPDKILVITIPPTSYVKDENTMGPWKERFPWCWGKRRKLLTIMNHWKYIEIGQWNNHFTQYSSQMGWCRNEKCSMGCICSLNNCTWQCREDTRKNCTWDWNTNQWYKWGASRSIDASLCRDLYPKSKYINKIDHILLEEWYDISEFSISIDASESASV